MNGGNRKPDYDPNMEIRLAKVEQDVADLKVAVKVIQETMATRTDIESLRTQIEALKAYFEARQTRMLMWIISAVFFAQLLPLIARHFS
jgi:hypothetical protein